MPVGGGIFVCAVGAVDDAAAADTIVVGGRFMGGRWNGSSNSGGSGRRVKVVGG